MVLVMLVRRHLVGAVALVMALAIGIALGSGPLSHESLLPSSASQAPPPVDREPAGPTGDDVAAAAAPALYGARLEGRSVALLSGPGVEPDTLDALAEAIESADGAVTARWTAGQGLVGAGEKALVDTLGSQLVEQLDGHGADPDASAYERMGQLIGTAVASRNADGAVPNAEALTIRQSIDAASLLRQDGGEPRQAPLVLLVLGDDLDDNIVEGLVSGLASRASGIVVAAPGRDSDLSVLDEL
ncbi:MAG: copper transporter, partial [Nocardioides sp.]